MVLRAPDLQRYRRPAAMHLLVGACRATKQSRPDTSSSVTALCVSAWVRGSGSPWRPSPDVGSSSAGGSRAEACGGAHLATADSWAPAARSVNRSSRGCGGGYLMLNIRCAREGFEGIEIPARCLGVRRRASANGWQIGPASGLCWHRGENGPHQFVRQGQEVAENRRRLRRF